MLEVVERLAFGAVAFFQIVQLLRRDTMALARTRWHPRRWPASARVKYSVRSEGIAYSTMSMSGWSARGAAASCNAEPARIAAAHQRAVAIATRSALWRSPRRNG